jgi:hypothetical protein
MKKIRVGVAATLVLGASWGISGCSSGGTGGTEQAVVPAGQGVTLEVTNEQRTEAEIWVLADGSRQRMGRVPAYGEETFLIPMDRGRTLRMEFRIFGGPTCITRDVRMMPGEAVSYTIPVNINLFDAVCR